MGLGGLQGIRMKAHEGSLCHYKLCKDSVIVMTVMTVSHFRCPSWPIKNTSPRRKRGGRSGAFAPTSAASARRLVRGELQGASRL